MSDRDTIVAETASRIFADLGDPQTLNQARDARWKQPLWDALEEAGLPLAWVPEESGGSGASLAEGFDVAGVAGRFAAPLPLAETLLAGWLAGKAGLACPAGPMTVAPARPGESVALGADGTVSGRVLGVPFAREAEHIAVLAAGGRDSTVALVARDACRIVEGRSLAGDPADTVIFERASPVAAAAVALDREAFMLMGAVLRSVETAGALASVLDMSVRYANERVAFERPIAKFQAVQHNLARLAGEVAAATAAAGSAADAVAVAAGFDDDAIFLEAASAKIRTAEAASEAAAIAHQVFGAIGFTREHVLHRFTLRMLSWREDFGHESHWAVALGKRVAARGADAFWPLVASR